MIVVGILLAGAPPSAAVVEIARRAAATGARTEIVGVAPAGSVGDRQLVELAVAGVGHATVTRSGAVGASRGTDTGAPRGTDTGAPPGTDTGSEPATAGIESADLELALRYLPDIRAIVLVEPGAALLATASAASAWSGATLIVVEPAEPSGAAIPAISNATVSASLASTEPIVLQPPARDPDGAFAGLVAALAVRLDAGEAPATAWQSTVAALAVDPA